jgi:hypothetical protein
VLLGATRSTGSAEVSGGRQKTEQRPEELGDVTKASRVSYCTSVLVSSCESPTRWSTRNECADTSHHSHTCPLTVLPSAK